MLGHAHERAALLATGDLAPGAVVVLLIIEHSGKFPRDFAKRKDGDIAAEIAELGEARSEWVGEVAVSR